MSKSLKILIKKATYKVVKNELKRKYPTENYLKIFSREYIAEYNKVRDNDSFDLSETRKVLSIKAIDEIW